MNAEYFLLDHAAERQIIECFRDGIEHALIVEAVALLQLGEQGDVTGGAVGAWQRAANSARFVVSAQEHYVIREQNSRQQHCEVSLNRLKATIHIIAQKHIAGTRRMTHLLKIIY